MKFKYRKSKLDATQFVMDVVKEIIFHGISKGNGIGTSDLRKRFKMSRQAFYWHTKKPLFRETLETYNIEVLKSKKNEKIYVFKLDEFL